MSTQSTTTNKMRGIHFEQMLGIEKKEMDSGDYCFLYYSWWTSEPRNGKKATTKKDRSVYKPLYEDIFELNNDLKDQELISLATDKQRKAMEDSEYAYVFSPGEEFNDDKTRSAGTKINTYRFYKKFKIEHDIGGKVERLEQNYTPVGLENRIVFRFEKKSSLSSVFDWSKNAPNFVVNDIEPEIKVTPFISYSETFLTYSDLEAVMKDKGWEKALSRVNCIYLIHDSKNGKNYIGSTYNKDGIFGRWTDYVNDPGGGKIDIGKGNKQLVELLQKLPKVYGAVEPEREYARKHFTYSILEVLPLNLGETEIRKVEQRWKKHLGTFRVGMLYSKYHLNSN